jgi:hypothetical protein
MTVPETFTVQNTQQLSECNHMEPTKVVAMPWLRQLVIGLSPQQPKFMPSSVDVRFVVDRVALEEIFLRILHFSR